MLETLPYLEDQQCPIQKFHFNHYGSQNPKTPKPQNPMKPLEMFRMDIVYKKSQLGFIVISYLISPPFKY